MTTNKTFDAYAFFSDMWKKNRLIQGEKFALSRVSGMEGLPNMLQDKQHSNFFAVDTTSDGKIYQAGNGGWFKRRVFTIFLLMRCRDRSENTRASKLKTCQDLIRQMTSYMIAQEEILANSGVRLNSNRIASHEFEHWVLMDVTGCYVVFNVDEPTDLKLNADEWTK